MKKYIFCLFLLGIATNALAMEGKRNLGNEQQPEEAPPKKKTRLETRMELLKTFLKKLDFDNPIYADDEKFKDFSSGNIKVKIEDRKERADEMVPFSGYYVLMLSDYFDAQHTNKIPLAISLSPDQFRMLKFLLKGIHNRSIGTHKGDWNDLANDLAVGRVESYPIELLFDVGELLQLEPAWLDKFYKHISPHQGLDLVEKNAFLKKARNILKNRIENVVDQGNTNNPILNALNNNPITVDIIANLTDEYKNITDILEHKKDFLQLDMAALNRIFRNENFQRDSENSMLAPLVMWLKENFEEREADFIYLVNLVDFSEMTPYFLLIVPSLITDFKFKKDNEELLRKLYVKALEDKNGIHKSKNINKPVQRASFYESSNERFSMKVEFRKISEWKVNEKYYSQPIFSNGYFFYFFMRVETNPTDQSQYLGGYLRCTSEVCNTPNHYLPVTVTFEVLLTNNRTRKFPPVSVVFDHFDRSIGSRMNQPTENWERIRLGLSDIVKEDKITVIISVDFKNNLASAK